MSDNNTFGSKNKPTSIPEAILAWMVSEANALPGIREIRVNRKLGGR